MAIATVYNFMYSCICSDQSSYVLKVAGQNSYIHGAYELMEFAYIIRCLIKKKDPDLALVERVDPSIDRLRDIEDVSVNLKCFDFRHTKIIVPMMML